MQLLATSFLSENPAKIIPYTSNAGDMTERGSKRLMGVQKGTGSASYSLLENSYVHVRVLADQTKVANRHQKWLAEPG